MKEAEVETGYLDLGSACFAETGNEVISVDAIINFRYNLIEK